MPQVRLLAKDKAQLGIFSIKEAINLAAQQELDLVEISPNAKPPVCRMMNYGKYLYQLKKQANGARKKQRKNQVKMIKLRPGTDESDYQVKFKNLIKFLNAGDKVKVLVWFRGREAVHKELGMAVLNRIQQESETFAIVEQPPKSEGRQLGMMLAPQSKNITKQGLLVKNKE